MKNKVILGWLVCILGAIFYCYEYLLRIEPGVIVQELMHQFSITASTIGMITALYYYAYTPMQLLVGMLIDRYGTRLILTGAVLACTIGSMIFNLANNIYLLGSGRFLIGLGSSFAFVGVLKLAAEWLPKHHFALFTGFATALGMLGAMVGTIGLTFLTHTLGWQHTLFIGTTFGLILIPLIWLMIRDKPGWKDANLKNRISFKEAFAGFLIILKNHQMWLSGIIGCIFYLSLSVFAELWGIPFLRAVYNLDAHSAAFACSMVFAGWLIGSPLSGWLSDKTKTRKLPLLFGGLSATVIASIIVFQPFVLSLLALSGILFLFGVFCSVQIICFAVSRENNPTHIAATAVGFTNLLIMLGGMVFQPFVGTLLDLCWSGQTINGVRSYSAENFQHSFWILPVLILLGTLLSLALNETHPDKVQKRDEFDNTL